MKTSRKDLLKTAKLLGAVDLNTCPNSLNEIQSYVVIAYSVGEYGLTAKLIFDPNNKKFYFITERNYILFSLN